jgi:acyl-CoA reductase-like NAD-dependent aldehyde dehydrogenase
MNFQTISPVDGRAYVERSYATSAEIEAALTQAQLVKLTWKATPIDERAAICSAAVDAFIAQTDAIAEELAWQMGRPVRYGAGEVRGFEERARYMIDIAPEKLADVETAPKTGFTRFIRREPLGLVLTLAPWNYPYLTAVNSIIPALMAGNVVILKHAEQTPLCAERLASAFESAGAPEGVFQILHASHEDVAKMVAEERVNFVAFTGSVAGGYAVQQAASGRFVGVGLELGGKDPAYIRADANLDHAIENVIDGAMFNSGQSCCAVERIYVHRDVYDQFVDGAVALTNQYILGDPLNHETTLGPVVRQRSADLIRAHIAEAISCGAKALIDEARFPRAQHNTPYVAPQILVNVDHSMRVMTEETFGPVVGVMPVSSDEEAIQLMNDSVYGLTASVWTADVDAAIRIGEELETGTVFMNRCDYLDPALAWTGVKQSGRGVSLSELGYEQLTQPKSFHLRTEI